MSETGSHPNTAVNATISQAISNNTSLGEEILIGQSMPNLSVNTKISSMGDLKKKNPQLYNQMMEGIASNMIIQMTAQNDRVVQAWRDMREDDD